VRREAGRKTKRKTHHGESDPDLVDRVDVLHSRKGLSNERRVGKEEEKHTLINRK
jgi:hypothetical protein